MHVTRNLGFSSLLLVLCLVVPVIWFVIRRKWRVAAARSEEIKRLLILASEEAARAEFEATVSYNSFPIANKNQCAVCYCPTSTRCAQCKAVRYCSGKCQIIHWRQGHKEECRPASITYRRDDGVGDSSKEASKLDKLAINDNKSYIESECYAKPINEPSENCLSSDDERNSEVSCGLDANIEVKPLEETKGSHSASELSTSTYSGFSSSNNSSESSDDASISETNTLHHLEQPDGHTLLDLAFGILDTNYDVDIIETMSNSPKFASLVDSVGGFTKLNKLNGTGNKGVSKHAPNGYSDYCSDTLDLDSNGCNSSRKSISVASPLYSYKASPASHAQAPGANRFELDGTCLNSAANSKPFTETASEVVRPSRIMDSPSANDVYQGPILTNDGTANSSHKLEIKEDKSVPSKSTHVLLSFKRDEDSSCTIGSGGNGLQLRSSQRSNYVRNDQSCVSHPINSSEVSSTSHERGYLCGTERHPIRNERCGENGTQSAISTSQAPTPSLSCENGLKASVSKVVDQLKGSKSSKYHPSMIGSETPGRYKDKGLFPYDLFVKLHIWNKVQLQPCGLINCGNSCYANVVLQCLAFTPPLTAYFLQKLHSKACIKQECCFTCKLESLILKANEGKSPLSPKSILSLLQNTGCQLGNGREEDAHEFLRHAIDTMQSICLMEAGIKASSSPEEDTTLVGLTFGGYLRSKIRCSKCGGKSERQERMMDLTVEIEGDILTLEEALERFTSTETLDGENKYHCVRCKSYEKAKKKLTVLEAPNVLTIALKRFQSGKFGKLNKPIRFPEILDLAPYMSGTSDKSPIYRLYAVVVHLDIMNTAFSGHYVCYAKNMKNKWFKMDDSVVIPVELESVLTKGAYMLFYARCSPRAPRLIRNRIISSEPKIKVIPPWISGKNTTIQSRSVATNCSISQSFTGPVSTDSSVTLESFYSKFQHVRKILEEDSSSDNLSLISNNSDEGSCSTDSTRDSSSTEDFSDYIFGDLGRGWNRNPDSDASSSSSPMCSTSSSPLYSRYSPLSNLERYDSRSTDATDPQSQSLLGAAVDGNANPCAKLPGESRKLVYSESDDSFSLVHSDATKNYCNIASGRCSNGISFRGTVEERLEFNSCNDSKSDVFFRTSTRTN